MTTRRSFLSSMTGVIPFAAALFAAPEATADDRGRGRGKRRGRGRDWDDDDWDDDRRRGGRNWRGAGGRARYDDWRFRGTDRRLIYDYYCGPAGPPVFLRNPRRLPPGLRRKLYRQAVLPTGWHQHFMVLDPVLVRRLPPVPYGYQRGFIGGNLVLVNRNTSVVLDVMSFLD